MHLTLIFRNQTQINLEPNFTDEDMKGFIAACKARRGVMLGNLFIDFAEVIFFSLTEKEEA